MRLHFLGSNALCCVGKSDWLEVNRARHLIRVGQAINQSESPSVVRSGGLGRAFSIA